MSLAPANRLHEEALVAVGRATVALGAGDTATYDALVKRACRLFEAASWAAHDPAVGLRLLRAHGLEDD